MHHVHFRFSSSQLSRQSSLEWLDHGSHQSLEPGAARRCIPVLCLQCDWLIAPAPPSDWLLSLTSGSGDFSPRVPRTGEEAVRDAGMEEPGAEVIILTPLVLLIGNLPDIEPGGFYRNLFTIKKAIKIKRPGNFMHCILALSAKSAVSMMSLSKPVRFSVLK